MPVIYNINPELNEMIFFPTDLGVKKEKDLKKQKSRPITTTVRGQRTNALPLQSESHEPRNFSSLVH